MNPARAPLPCVDVPELLQVRVAKRVREGRIPFVGVTGRRLETPTTNGALVLHSDAPDFVFWRPDSGQEHVLSLGRPTRAIDLDVSGQQIAMAATGEIRLFDRAGAIGGRVPLESQETEAFVRFDRSGTLWVLTHIEKRARLRAVDSSGAVIDQLEVRDREDLRPAWWLEIAMTFARNSRVERAGRGSGFAREAGRVSGLRLTS